jgi:hypothetical protein
MPPDTLYSSPKFLDTITDAVKSIFGGLGRVEQLRVVQKSSTEVERLRGLSYGCHQSHVAAGRRPTERRSRAGMLPPAQGVPDAGRPLAGGT